MGNPLNYISKSVLGDEIVGTLEWNGRQLVAVNQGNKRYEYFYNSDGLRTSIKTYSNGAGQGTVLCPVLKSLKKPLKSRVVF